MNSPMIASGGPMNTSASAPPTIVANICIPDFTFLALGAGGLSSEKNRVRLLVFTARQFDPIDRAELVRLALAPPVIA